MSPREEIVELRDFLARLAREGEAGLRTRYALWHPPGVSRTPWRHLRRLLGRVLRRLKLRPTPPAEPWLAGLSYTTRSAAGKPLVIWALQYDPDRIRESCEGVDSLLSTLPGYSPILITDVADFAFYSRLGWLVEYVPDLNEPAGRYAERKRDYLAWRYRDAPALPLSIGLTPDVLPGDLLLD